MGTSFVEFHEKGYWTHDAYLEALSYLLAREFAKFENIQAWQKQLIDEWTAAAIAGFSGCVPSYFEYFDTHDKVHLLRKTLICILEQLKKNPDFLTVAELKDEKVGQRVWIEADLTGCIQIAHSTLDLIDGKLKTNASSPINYWRAD